MIDDLIPLDIDRDIAEFGAGVVVANPAVDKDIYVDIALDDDIADVLIQGEGGDGHGSG